ncbi:hypothetical protein BT63DRAFT_258899 [Microthyrium microscopicum]|uniref:ER lumen protein retaining receptor n=1 Tax=Microthyrium microscopicum TaxID=703497 RepID=A0A6A6UD79_9PEZI|nr:hypothetical protein BT63DRAFT_258899 [Microthyrium microscopicum]
MADVSSAFNIFRVTGDVSHILSKIILIWSIHWNRSAEGVSLITQALYILVFSTRYLDIFSTPIFKGFKYFYLFAVKLFYVGSSVYIVSLMTFAYARTREREKAWKFGIYCLTGALILAWPLCKIFEKGPFVGDTHFLYRHDVSFSEILWVFSEVLESVCVLPQLLLLRQTTVPTVIDSYYLTLLGSYRGLYCLNWIYRAASKVDRHFDPISVVFGVIQTALYIDFAWVYYSRQRVKLRAGGIVDSDDLERGWLVGRFVGKHRDLDDDAPADVEQGVGRQKTNRWGARGISVSADDEFDDASGEDARPLALADPDAFEDELSDDESAPPAASNSKQAQVHEEAESPWAAEESSSK